MKISGLLPLLVLIIFGCSKEENNPGAETILIKGKLTSSAKGVAESKGIFVDILDSKKVMIFYGNRYDLAEITDGTFSAAAEVGGATALVFLDGSNRFIGNLFAGGLNILPLNKLEEGRVEIDLQNLTLEGTRVIPSHDPIGDEINISEEEVVRYREIGTYYESLAKNIDANNDGVPDILNKKDLRITSHFSVTGGKWGINNTAPMQFDASNLITNYQVRIEGNISLAPTSGLQVRFEGPSDGPYTDISQNRYVAEKDCFIAFFRRESQQQQGNGGLPFRKGIYTFSIENQSFTLNYSNIDAKYYLVIASPTLQTDNEGKITSVTVEYKLPNNTIVDPEDFVTILQLQFQKKDGSRLEMGSLYEAVESNRRIKDIKNITLDTPFPISDLSGLSVNYNDFLGNEYDVTWRDN
jgi:hypothetical protein